MKTPIVDQMLKSLTWQTENSHFTTQRDIDLVSELKYLKEQLILSGVVVSETELCGSETEINLEGCTCETGVCFLKHEY